MFKKIAYWVFIRIPFWTIVASLLLVTVLKWAPVRYTPLMLKRSVQFRQDKDYRTDRQWVPLDHFSPELIQSVLSCEDNHFMEHKGFDWKEIEKMLDRHEQHGKKIRGCSTISQQTAKNVFTWGSRTWFRKAAESYWTVLIEWIWGKRRIMEVYLNVVETGRGLFGMEAAALHYFGIHACHLDYDQSLALAVCLPSPLKRSPLQLTQGQKKRRIRMMNNIRDSIRTRGFPDWAR